MGMSFFQRSPAVGVRVGPDQGPYSGVPASLAGANAGYAAGGPGSTGAPNAPIAPTGGVQMQRPGIGVGVY